MIRDISSLFESVPREAWAVLSVLIGAVGYIVYIHKTIRDRDVQPHPLSWFAWTFATFMAALVQSKSRAGSGAWVTWAAAASGLVVLSCAIWKQLRRREGGDSESYRNSKWEWISIGLSLLAAILFASANLLKWAQIANMSAALATFASVAAFQPTIAKGWAHPYSDSSLTFFLNGIKFVPAYAALNQRSPATTLFPVTLIFFNSWVSLMLLWKRRRTRIHGNRNARIFRRASHDANS